MNIFKYPPPCLRHAWREVLRGWASDPSEILCRNSRRAWKVTESDFPQEESLKVTILTGGVSHKSAECVYSSHENVVHWLNVAKTQGVDHPPHYSPSPFSDPARPWKLVFFLRCSENLSEPPFSRCRGLLDGPGPPKWRPRPPFGSLLGTFLHQIGDGGPLVRTLLFTMFSLQIHTSGEGGCRSKTILAPVVPLKARFSQLLVVLVGPGPRKV